MRRCVILFIVVVSCLGLPRPCQARFFLDVTQGTGLLPPGNINRASWVDLDEDGDLDLYLSLQGRADLVLLNDSGRFSRLLGVLPIVSQTGIAWGDYNSDGLLDLFSADAALSGLYRNGAGTIFTDEIKSSQIDSSGWQGDAQWVDIDGDLDLDLSLIADQTAPADSSIVLYTNNGAGVFSSSTAVFNPPPGRHTAISWTDVNNDGDPDLFLPGLTMVHDNRLYLNEDGNFTDNASALNLIFPDSQQTGTSWVDVDDDGDLDLFIAHMAPAADRLLLNQDGSFTDATTASNLGWGGGSVAHGWTDFDLDGRIDLLVAGVEAPQLYLNQGDAVFSEVSKLEGLGSTRNITTAAWGDYDSDGDPDLFLAGTDSTSNILYRNETDPINRWLTVQLTGPNGQAGGVGARVLAQVFVVTTSPAEAPTDTLTRDTTLIQYERFVNSQMGRTSHHSVDVSFGLGPAVLVDSLSVTWQSELTQTFTQIPSNQFLKITEGTGSSEAAAGIPNIFARSDTVSVPVRITRSSSMDPVRSAQFTLIHDQCVTFRRVVVDSTTLTDGWTLVENSVTGSMRDTLRIALFTNDQSFVGTGTLAQVEFFVTDSEALKCNVDLISLVLNDGFPGVGLLSSGEIRMRGKDASLSSTPDTVGARQAVSIRLVDSDANLNDGDNDVALVTASNTAQDDIETLLLLETGPTTGTFVGDLLTAASTTPAIQNDGLMTVAAGDTILVVWIDLLTNLGSAMQDTLVIPVVRGGDALLVAEPNVLNPTDSLIVVLSDFDQNAESETRDSLLVTLIAAAEADTEAVYVRETGTDNGAFVQGVSTAWDSALVGSQAVVGDGVLTVALTDSIILQYVDLLAASGDTATVVDTAFVVPWPDALPKMSYVVQASASNQGRDIVHVQVDDGDANLDDTLRDEVIAFVTNAISTEVETLTMMETEPASGRFRTSLGTLPVTDVDRDTALINNDGSLSIAAGDSLILTFLDSLGTDGDSSTVTVTSYVVDRFGDLDLNGSIQAFDASLILEFSVDEMVRLSQDSAPPSEWGFFDFLTADVNGDNEISSFDAFLTARFVVNIIQVFPVETDVETGPGASKNHPFRKPVVPEDAMPFFGSPLVAATGLHRFPLILPERAQVLSIDADIMIEGGTPAGMDPMAPFDSFLRAGKAYDGGFALALAGLESHAEGEGPLLHLIVQPDDGVEPVLRIRRLSINEVSYSIPYPLEISRPSRLLRYAFHPSFPNPFNPQTTLAFELPEAGQVTIQVYNVLGQLIRTLVNRLYEPGEHTVIWKGVDAAGTDVATGVYLLRLQAGDFSSTRKALLLR